MANLALLERSETRFTAPFEIRANTAGGYDLEGYAALFDTPYEVSDWLGDYTEVIRAGAFKRTLGQGADVRLLINHEGLALARTKPGTLSLSEDDIGLLTRASLAPESPRVQELKSSMDRGDTDQMSFQFRAIEQMWSPDWSQRDLLECQLFDVAVVTFPANEATSVSLRSSAVSRWGADVWGRIETCLRTGEPMDSDTRAAYLRALAAAGVAAPEDVADEQTQRSAQGRAAHVRGLAALAGI